MTIVPFHVDSSGAGASAALLHHCFRRRGFRRLRSCALLLDGGGGDRLDPAHHLRGRGGRVRRRHAGGFPRGSFLVRLIGCLAALPFSVIGRVRGFAHAERPRVPRLGRTHDPDAFLVLGGADVGKATIAIAERPKTHLLGRGDGAVRAAFCAKALAHSIEAESERHDRCGDPYETAIVRCPCHCFSPRVDRSRPWSAGTAKGKSKIRA